MSQTVDSKVVEMQFDNAQFERNVATSMSTLNKLKAALNFGDSAKSLETLEAAAGRVNMGGLTGAVETVSSKFSAFEVVAITALANITNSVVNAGKRLVSSLSIDNITAGWTKFGEKTQSVATLTAQGYALEEVNKQLDKLNWFTDETSYNFTDMTSNIAKFTATGQNLETSVTAMQGIANWAALSGQNAMTASRAMYQLSQAMGAGVMRKEDYKSIQNASMDTKEFRQHALDAAVALGTLQKNADGTYRSIVEGVKAEDFEIGQFADHLTKDLWFTSDVMMKVFQEYSSAVQPIYDFTEEYDLLASEVLEAKHKYDEGGESFKDFVDTLDLSEKGRKDLEELVKNLDDFGVKALEAAQQASTWADVVDSVKDAVSTAWMKTFEIIFGTQEEATKLFTAMANELYDIFAEPINGLNELLEEGLGADSVAFASEAFKKANKELDDFTGRGVLIDAFAKIWRNLLDTLDIIPEAFRQVFPEVSAEQLYDAIVKFHDFAESLRLSDEMADKLSRTFYGVFSVFDIVKTVVGTIADAVLPELIRGFSDLAGHVLGVTGDFGVWIGELKDSIKSSERLQKIADTMASAIRKAFEIIEGVISIVGPLVRDFVGTVKDNFETPGFTALSGLLDSLGQKFDSANQTAANFRDKVSNIFAGIKVKLDESGFFAALQNIWTVAKTAGKWVFESLGQGIGAIVKAVANADFKGLVDFFGSLAGVGVGVGAIGLIKELKDFIAVLKEGKAVKKENPITSLITSVKDTLEAVQDKLKPDQLRAIAVSIAILAGSVFVLSRIDSDKLAGSLGTMLGIFIELMGMMYTYSKLMNGVELAGVTGVMIGISTGILILSGALKKIADIEPDRLLNSVLALGAVMLELVTAMTILNTFQDYFEGGALQLVAVAAAVRILASACKTIADIDPDKVWTAVGVIGALLGELALFSVLTSDTKHMVSTGLGMIAIAAAMKILASAVKSFGNLSVEQIAKGLGTMASVLLELAIAVNLMPMKILAIGPGLIAVSTALVIMSGALRIMGGMSWDSIGRGLTVLGGSMLILAVGVNAMSGALAGAAALTIVAGALAILTPILVVLGKLKLTTISKALFVLAGVFTVLGVAGVMLAPLVGTLASLAGVMALMGASVALFGVGLVAAGAGLVSIAAGLTAFAAAVAAQGPLILAGIKMMLIGIVDFIPSIIGTLATSFAKGIITFVKVVADAAPELLASVVRIIGVLVDAVVTCAPQIAEGLLKLILAAFELLAEYAPQITDAAIRFLGGVLTTIGKHLSNIDLSTFVDALLGVGAIAAFMAALGALVGLIPGAMVGVLGLGVLIAELGGVFAALGMLKQIPGVEWFIDQGGDFAAKIGNAVGKFIGGIVGGVAEGAASSLPKIGSYLAEFMNNASPFFDKVETIGYGAFDAVSSLADAIMTMTQARLLDGITGWITGSASINTFAASLIDLATGLKEYTEIIDDADFNDEKIEASKNLAQMLAAFASQDIPRQGGLISLILGNKDLGKFGKQLEPLASGLRSYAGLISITEFNDEKLEASTKLTQMLGDIASTSIPKTSGLLDALGEGKITSFATQLLPLAKGLRDYAGLISVTEFNDEKIEASRHLAAMLGTLASTKIPKSGGLIGLIEGDNSLATFGKQLPPLGTALSKYAENLGKSINNKTAISTSIEMLTSFAGFSDKKLPSFSEAEVTAFKVSLPALAEGMKDYVNKLEDVKFDNDKLESSRKLAAMLAALASTEIPSQGGMITFLEGGHDLGNFGSQISLLADGLKAYSEKIDGASFNDEKIAASKGVLEMLSSLGAAMPMTGGLLQQIAGEPDLFSFSQYLPALAIHLTRYADSLGDSLLNSEKIEASANVVKIVTALSSVSTDRAKTGIFGMLLSGDDISKFGDQLPKFGKALSDYADNLSDNLGSDKVEKANALATMLMKLQGDVSSQNNGGFFSSGELEKFGQNLGAFGAYLVAYCNDISLVNPDEVQAATEKLVTAINTMIQADIDGIADFVEKMKGGATDIAGAATALMNAFTTALTADLSSVESSAETIVNSVATGINSKASLVELSGTTIGTSFKTKLDESTKDIPSDMQTLLNTVVTDIVGKRKDFEDSGLTIGAGMNDGIGEETNKTPDIFGDAMDSSVSTVKGFHGEFYSAGSYLVSGFANGISENTWKAEAQARAMANAAAAAAQRALNEHSPSKVFFKIGDYAGIGFVNALAMHERTSYNAGYSMADSARAGLVKAMAQVIDAVDSGIELRPTISPVLDLDDIRAGTGAINGLFNQSYPFGMNSNIGAINLRMSNREMRTTNEDVVSAINDLKRSLSDTPRNVYNVNGITYDDGSNISSAVRTLVRAAVVEGRA